MAELDVGIIGISIDEMLVCKHVFIYVDGERHEVHSDEDIRSLTKVVIVKKVPRILIRQVREGAKGLGYIHDDYKSLAFTGTETSYEIGQAAHKADKAVPKFEAQVLNIQASQNCFIRFNEVSRVQHPLIKDTVYTYYRRCRKLYVVKLTTDGVLYIRAVG